MTNLVTGEIDESCNPPDITFWFINLDGNGPYDLSTDGSFSIEGSGTTEVDGSPAPYSIKIGGTVSGTSASGVLHVGTSLTLNGQGYDWQLGRPAVDRLEGLVASRFRSRTRAAPRSG
jgi:hypothetical protein